MPELTIQNVFDLALKYHQAGQLREAEPLYRQVLAQQPGHVAALHYLGVIAYQVGRAPDAVELIRRAIALVPDYTEAYCNLGVALKDAGRHDEAVAAYRRAIAINPNYSAAFNNLGVVLKEMGKLDEAIAAARRSIALAPHYAEAHNNLGIALTEKGELDEAIASCRAAIAINPSYAQAYSNLGASLKEKGRFDEAIAAYRHAIALNPRLAEAHNNLGNALKYNDQLDQAVSAYRQALAVNPNFPDACNNLGVALSDQRRFDEAIITCRQAITLKPDSVTARRILANALQCKGLLDDAIVTYRQAVALNPGSAEAHNGLGMALKEKGQLDESVSCCSQAIALNPRLAEPYNNLGNALKDMGKVDQAIAAYRQATAADPDYVSADNNLVFTLEFQAAHERRAIAEELRRWNRQHVEPLRKLISTHSNDRTPDRRLRIGLVSPDFRDHVVGLNLLPLFRHHDRGQFEFICYSNVLRPDAVTSQFHKLADDWREIVCLSNKQAADQIQADRIDILMDLALHMANNRLLIFARKPAPVQVTFAGYPGSTGMDTIDYRLSDPYLDPPGMDESVYSEKTIRLPESFWCYDPLDCRDIPVNTLPALDEGVVTFGCLNNFCKVNERILKVWAQVLRQVENSRLLLLAPPGSHRQKTVELLSLEGIDPSRVQFVGQQSRAQYLSTYHRIDLGLDTYPYNGHTTSLDSFWMGVPVVTLMGQTVVARAGWCQLSNLGLTDLAGQSPEEFVRIAVELARDLPRMKKLRSTLRLRMEQSPLMDAPKFAGNVEAAYRRMWRTWCETASPGNRPHA